MGTPKEVYSPLVSQGLVLKTDPSLLQPGQYSVATNTSIPIEGVVSVRGGTQTCFLSGLQSVVNFLHTIARLVIPNQPTARYVGVGPNIYRTTSSVGPGMSFTPLQLTYLASGASTSTNIALQRWGDCDYGSEGYVLAYKFFACPNVMVKDNGSLNPLQSWGVFPPAFPVRNAVNTSIGTGPVAFTGAEVPYTYVYTYLNVVSGAESNPCMIMNSGVTPNGYEIQITLSGTYDTQISTTAQSIKVYRAGGSFGDGLYRLLGYSVNPGSTSLNNPNTVVFNDTYQDADILSNDQLATDNDPPVPSGLPVQFVFPSQAKVGTGSANSVAGCIYDSTGGPIQGPTGFWPKTGDTITVTVGSLFSFQAIVTQVTVGVEIDFYTQVNLFQGTTALLLNITCSVSTGAPCTLALTAFNSIFLAGDANNPNFLYQSKPNQPESFPVIQQSTGIIQTLSVGTPSDKINGITEYSGAIVCLNLESIYFVSVYQNQMQSPVRTPARHGLITPNAWAKLPNEIWYLSYDGIYSFTGGQESWMSEAVDPLFKGMSMNGYLPVNMTPGLGGNNPPVGLDVITMTVVDNNIVLNYTDTAGTSMRMWYEQNFKRWHIEQYYVGLGYGLYAQFSEPDTGYSWIGLNVPGNAYPRPQLDLVNTGTTDGWTTNPASGTPIQYQWSPTVIDQQAKTDKLFSDIQIESATSDNASVNVFYDWSTASDPTDVFSIPASGRQRYPFVLQQSEGKYAYAMRLLFSGSATGSTNFYTIGLHYEDLTDYRVGLSSDFSDLGYANDKTLRSATVEIDTGGVPCTIFLDVDAQVAVQTFTVTTTYFNRKVVLSINSFITGRMVRLRFLAGAGGKANLYGGAAGIKWDVEPLPPSVTHFDSNSIAFNWDGYNFVKQVWLCLLSSSAVTFNLYVDNDQLFWTEVIPAMPARGVYRFYLPSVNGTVLNKSKIKRFTLDSPTGFSMYGMSSRLEWLPCGSDQRQDYEQFPLTETMQPQ